jgi:GntR family transcriptional regulator
LIPFRVHFRPGISLYEQLVYAAKKAIISGQLRPSDPFPSVRALSKDLKINPNTAHKVVTHLVAERLLETRAGIGTVVAEMHGSSSTERTQLLGYEIEQLVVEAKKLGIGVQELFEAITGHWKKLSGEDSASAKQDRGGRSKR